MPTIRESDLPGIGRKFQMDARSGDKIVVIVQDDGQRAIYHFHYEDPDEPISMVTLDDAEARQLAAIIGGLAYQPKYLENLDIDVNDLMIKWYKVEPSSPVVGKLIGELEVRKTTGASIIAIINEDKTKRINPGPEEMLKAGQTLVVAGERRQVKVFERFLAGESR